MSEAIVRGGTILTVDPEWHIVTGDVACLDGALVQVGGDYTPTARDYDVLDAEGCVVLPGLIQPRVASSHQLARGRADQLDRASWHARMWQFESHADREDVAVAARLAATELLAGGTTTIVDVGAGAHAEVQLEVARDAGLRALVGSPLADRDDAGPPAPPLQAADSAIDAATSLCRRWADDPSGRVGGVLATRDPRWCSDDLLITLAAEARTLQVPISIDFGSTPAAQVGDGVARLAALDLLGEDLLLSGLTADDAVRDRLREAGCPWIVSPTAELRLGRGPAPIADLLADGQRLALAAGSAAAAGRLDGFREMHLAALLGRSADPASLSPSLVLGMATRGGARALGRERDLGSLEVGKRADLIVVDVATARAAPAPDPYRTVVSSCGAGDVRHVICDGRVVVRDGRLLTLEIDPEDARRRARHLFERMAKGSR